MGLPEMMETEKKLKFYLAPLEGITGCIFRNAVRDYFGDGIDKYFTPFFAPHTKRKMNSREIRDILPEHNEGIFLVPQILTDSAPDFLKWEKEMRDFGYGELNINLGCPSNTVVPKGRGAGFLIRIPELKHFLDQVFEKTEAKVSVKTRLGMQDPEEFFELLEIYNRYPMEELIIHPRIRTEMYSGEVHKEIFNFAKEHSSNTLCYNGDIRKPEDIRGIGDGPVASVMVGRGMVRDPSAIRQMTGGEPASREELQDFLERLLTDYMDYNSGETPVLHKMKEIWAYMEDLFPENASVKKIFRADRISGYRAAVREVFRGK